MAITGISALLPRRHRSVRNAGSEVSAGVASACYVFPALDLVVAQYCGNYHKPGTEQRRINDAIIAEIVLPSVGRRSCEREDRMRRRRFISLLGELRWHRSPLCRCTQTRPTAAAFRSRGTMAGPSPPAMTTSSSTAVRCAGWLIGSSLRAPTCTPSWSHVAESWCSSGTSRVLTRSMAAGSKASPSTPIHCTI